MGASVQPIKSRVDPIPIRCSIYRFSTTLDPSQYLHRQARVRLTEPTHFLKIIAKALSLDHLHSSPEQIPLQQEDWKITVQR